MIPDDDEDEDYIRPRRRSPNGHAPVYSAREMRSVGYSPAELRAAGYTAEEVREAGCKNTELRAAGFSDKHISRVGVLNQPIERAPYSIDEVKRVGWLTASPRSRPPPTFDGEDEVALEIEHAVDIAPRTAFRAWNRSPAGHAAAAVPVNDATGEYGRLLVRASASGDVRAVQQLVAARAPIETRGVDECTSLILAASNGHQAVVSLLVHAGAAIDAVSASQTTALVEAAEAGREGCVAVLIESGAHLEASFRSGTTPLIVAACHGHEGVVAQLLAAGASRTAKDGKGRSALEHAMVGKHKGVVSLLEAPNKPKVAATAAPIAMVTSGGNSALAAELREVLGGCHVAGSVGAALAWCEAQGVDDLAMLREVQLEEALVAALALKPAKATQVLMRLQVSVVD